MDYGLVIALIGLVFSTALAMVLKHAQNNFLAILGLINIILTVALIWRVALSIGWWTILAFILVGFFSGFLAAYTARKNWTHLYYGTTSVQAIVVAACTAAAWFIPSSI